MSEYLKRLQEAIASSVAGMTPEELSRHPEGKWSAVEVLEHLYLTYTGTVKGCERCLEKGEPQVTPATFRQRIGQFIVITAGHMPGGLKAAERLQPKGLPREQVVGEIGLRISSMEEVLQRCESRFGQATKFLNHPVLGPLTAAPWRKFHWVHGWHHVKQIRRLRQG
jgi:hypothetical protein